MHGNMGAPWLPMMEALHRQPGGILGNRDKLLQLGIKVLTDEEAVAKINQLIQDRDNREREKSNIMGQPLPEWVGRD